MRGEIHPRFVLRRVHRGERLIEGAVRDERVDDGAVTLRIRRRTQRPRTSAYIASTASVPPACSAPVYPRAAAASARAAVVYVTASGYMFGSPVRAAILRMRRSARAPSPAGPRGGTR